MTLSNNRFTFLPQMKSDQPKLPARGRRPAKSSRWTTTTFVVAIVGALWLSFDLPSQDARSVVASLTPVAAFRCASAHNPAAECSAPARN